MAKVEVKDVDKGFKRIQRELEKAKGSFVKVGVLSDAGQYESKGTPNLADVATWNEFGTGNIPSRPFLRTAFDRNVKALIEHLTKEKDSIFEGKKTVKGALNSAGVFFTGKVKEIFRTGDFKPNAPITIWRKNRKVVAAAHKTLKAARKRKGDLSEKQYQRVLKANETLAKAGTATPLIDTGRLRQSINFETVMGGGEKKK